MEYSNGMSILSTLSLGLILLASPALTLAQEQILRVGVVDGAQPCSYQEEKAWRGIAVDLWRLIAANERFPYTVSTWSSVNEMLEATRDGKIDLAVSCINISPERLEHYQFSIPFQEDGQAVMTATSSFNYTQGLLKSVFSLTLLKLLAAYFIVIFLIAASLWKIEGYSNASTTREIGAARSFSNLFLCIFAGPGSNNTVKKIHGIAIIGVVFLIRTVFVSLLVGYITLAAFRESTEKLTGEVSNINDLLGLRVGLRPGTVSELLITELNAASIDKKAVIVPLESISSAIELLESKRVDAILADEREIMYVRSHQSSKTLVTGIPIKCIRPEPQSFAYSPNLQPDTIFRINHSIVSFKRSGAVSSLNEIYLAPATMKKN